jgi:uncharacterized protein Smg (DUF494 family)
MGTPPLQQFTLEDNGFLQRLRKLQVMNPEKKEVSYEVVLALFLHQGDFKT